MRGSFTFYRCSLFVAVTLLSTAAAVADPPDILRNYRFISSRSTVDVTGGFAGLDWTLAIQGQFGLVTGYNYGVSPTAHVPTLEPFAQFVDVKAILYNPLSAAPLPVPSWDLDKTLNLSGLDGTFQVGDPSQLFFRGQDGQGQPIKLAAVSRGPLLLLRGANDPGCCDFFNYKISALAHLVPYADFNLDGVIDRTDANLLMSNYGLAAGATFEQGDADGDGDVDGNDFITWQLGLGPAVDVNALAAAADAQLVAPEPASAALAVVAILMGWCFSSGRSRRTAAARR